MPSAVLPFDAKPQGYFEHPRPELTALLPRPLGAVLDVGCGAGGVGRSMREAGADELVGIELDPVSAQAARSIFDEVLVGDAQAMIDELARRGDKRFDTICCYDVLEHLWDPASVAEGLHSLARPGGRLHVSLPNARWSGLFKDLYLRGTFGYVGEGHRDVTHLRWFTRRDIVRLLEDTGWTVVGVEHPPLTTLQRALVRVSGELLRELWAYQWFVLARA